MQSAEVGIQREIASCFANLSLSSNHHVSIAQRAMPDLISLIKCSDVETVRLSLGALGNLAEGIETHVFMTSSVKTIVDCLEQEEIAVKREAGRLISNLLSSCEVHPLIIDRGLDSLILLSANSCQECKYLTASSFHNQGPRYQDEKCIWN